MRITATAPVPAQAIPQRVLRRIMAAGILTVVLAIPGNGLLSIAAASLRPDLRIEALSVAARQFNAGQPRQVTVSFRVVNVGEGAAERAFRTRIFPGTVAATGPAAVSVTTNGLASGGIAYLSRTVIAPVGQFGIQVEADSDGVIDETDESNNVASAHFENPTPDVGRWVSIGPTRITSGLGAVGRITSIAIHPTSPSTIYVGARGSGVWKTTDGGSSWQPVADSLPSLNIGGIAVDPSTPSRVYLATPRGIFRSEDGGTGWSEIYSSNLHPYALDGGAFLVHPGNPDVLYLTSTDGVYGSRNRGQSWDLVLSGGPATSLVIDPSNPSRLHAALSHESDSSIAGVYLTENGGAAPADWRKLQGCPGGRLPTPTGKLSVHLARSKGRFYTSYQTSSSWTLYRTTNIGCSIGGQSESSWEAGWNPTGSIGGNPIYRRLWSWLYADPADPKYVYAGGTDFWLSTNGGSTFSRIPGPHVDHHGFAISPADSKVIYTGSDGGIYRSANRGAAGTWTFVGEGIANVEFYDIADAPTSPRIVTGGTQDNGASLYNGSSTVWRYMVGGDSALVEIDSTNAIVLYEVGQEIHQMKRSTNGGVGWSNIGGGLPEGCGGSGEFGPQDNQLLVHPTTSATIFATCNSLLRGPAWATVFRTSAGSVVRLAIDTASNRYFAGTSQGTLHESVGLTGWQVVFTHPSRARIVDMEIDLDEPGILFLAFAGTETGRVYRLERSISGTFTSRDITSNLPAGLAVNTVAVDRMHPFTIYAGMKEGGVYRGRSTNGGLAWTWSPYNNGLPAAVTVTDLEVHPVTGVMRAGTFGRSAYEVNTDSPIGSTLAAEGKINLLRAHNVGTKYGPPTDQIDVEVVVQIDTHPGRAFGFQLRNDGNEGQRRGMLDVLRDTFSRDRRVRIEYVRTGLRTGLMIRATRIP